jgi:hypothetical protein
VVISTGKAKVPWYQGRETKYDQCDGVNGLFIAHMYLVSTDDDA